MVFDLIFILMLIFLGGELGGGGHLNYCGIQVGPSKKISDEEEGHHILQELPVKAHQPPPPLPPHERTPS